MRKFIAYYLLFIAILVANNVFAGQWRNGIGENTILGTSNVSDIDSNTYNKMIDPLDRVLAGYREGATIAYNDAASVTVSAGELMLSNAAGTTRLMVRNTAALTSTWSVTDNGLDAGTEASSTTYYVYAVVDNASDETFKIRISTSNTAPTGFTYYKRLGSFYNDGSSNITRVANDGSLITDVFDYATSHSSYTRKTGGIKIAYGQATWSNGSTVTISNLPFESSSSYKVVVSPVDSSATNTWPPNVYQSSGSSFTIGSTTTGATTGNWIAIGI